MSTRTKTKYQTSRAQYSSSFSPLTHFPSILSYDENNMAADGGQGVTVSNLKYTCAAGHECSSKILTSFHQQFDIQHLSLFWTVPLVIFAAIINYTTPKPFNANEESKAKQTVRGILSNTSQGLPFLYNPELFTVQSFPLVNPAPGLLLSRPADRDCFGSTK